MGIFLPSYQSLIENLIREIKYKNIVYLQCK